MRTEMRISYGNDHDSLLILESTFEEYAQEMAEEVGAINPDAGWPLGCIDWERAARELAMDYTLVRYDGSDYYVRA